MKVRKSLLAMLGMAILFVGTSCIFGPSESENKKDQENVENPETGDKDESGKTDGTESDGKDDSAVDLSKLTSIQFAAAMKSGWNLGNTFDSAEYGNKTNKGESYETAWSMPRTTQAMINAVADKGFKTIRIPVSWHNHIINETNLTIDSAWLARVKEVVDWAIAKDMFVIINIHHDNLTSSEMSSTYGFSVNTKASENTVSKNYIEKIWTQVATYFKNYDEHLIFELLNEPRDRDGNNSGFDASGLSGGATLAELNAIIAQYDQTALNAIRATGGNNANRFVMAPYYAAQPWSSTGWSVPTDTATDKVLIAVHAYDPYKFAMGDMTDTDFDESVEGAELANLFTNCLKAKWTSKGYGVVMGEASCTDKHNLSDRLAWFESYVSKAKAINCPVILWDNMEINDSAYDDVAECHGYFNRNNLTWFFPTLVEKMITTAGGSVSIWTGSKDLKHWNGEDGVTVSKDMFASATASSYIQITISKGAECSAIDDKGATCSNNYSVMQLITGWSNGNVKGTTNTSGASVNSENDQLVVTNIIPDSGTVTVNFTPSSWSSIKANGLIIYGHKVTINEIKLFL